MKGALDGGSNYSPIASSPPFTGSETSLLQDPTVPDGVLYLAGGVVRRYSPGTRESEVLVEGGDVTALVRSEGNNVYYSTDSGKVSRYTTHPTSLSLLLETQFYLLPIVRYDHNNV